MTPLEYAILKHDGQRRQHGADEPYILHPVRVAYLVRGAGLDEDAIQAALLHDVVEDTDWSLGVFLDDHSKRTIYALSYKDRTIEISERIHQALNVLKKVKNCSYINYLRDIVDDSTIYNSDRLSMKVKLADMFHNMSCNPTDKQKAKYLKGIKVLLKSL